jgi:hypothetical protein
MGANAPLTLLLSLGTASESEDDHRSVEDEIASLIQQFGQDGTCYEDSRVVDMLNGDHVDQDRLLELLRCIQQDWTKDQGSTDRGMKQ